jgi:hypothetical protein
VEGRLSEDDAEDLVKLRRELADERRARREAELKCAEAEDKRHRTEAAIRAAAAAKKNGRPFFF